jgi:ribosomal protein L32E
MNKICTNCGRDKPLEDFHKESNGKFGRKSRCAECCTLISKKWKEQNKNKEIENRKKWNTLNKERHKKLTYEWRNKNKQKHNNYIAKWQKERKQKDSKYRMLSSIRSLVSNHFKNRNICKTKHLEDLIDMPILVFFNRMKELMSKEMTEENYGSYWSFDHVCPCSVARNEEELIKLQNWLNWRPMVHLGPNGNLAKQDKITEESRLICLELLKREP